MGEAPGKSGPPGASLGGNGVISHAVSHVTEKLHGHENQHPLGTVAEWADDADRRNASRHDASATREADVNGQLDGINEKAAMGRTWDEAPSPVQPAGDETFPSLDSTMLSPPTTEHEKNTQQHRKTTFSSTTSGDKEKASTAGSSTLVGGTLANHGSTKKRRRGTTKGSRRHGPRALCQCHQSCRHPGGEDGGACRPGAWGAWPGRGTQGGEDPCTRSCCPCRWSPPWRSCCHPRNRRWG